MSNDIRKAPCNAVFRLHPQGVRGICCWCGGAVTETTPTRGWLKYWHDACQAEYQICNQPDMARRFVRERDNGVCAECGSPPETIERTKTHGKKSGHTWEWTFETELWHVDHKVPLWKVVHLPDIERIDYFKLANLVTLCEKCHHVKSKHESAERAHFKRLASPKPKKESRMKSAGFRKAKRSMNPPRVDRTKYLDREDV